MREFILLAESLRDQEGQVVTEAEEVVETAPVASAPLISDLLDVVFRLRAFTENAETGDFALGIETGMQRAADMIERVLREHGSL